MGLRLHEQRVASPVAARELIGIPTRLLTACRIRHCSPFSRNHC